MMPMPVYIDEPKQYLIWSVDELVPVGFMLIVGTIIGQLLASSIIGLVVSVYYRRFKESKPEGFAEHLFYWYGLNPGETRTFPSPFRKSFFG